MIFFDTNVLVYTAITQDINKQKISDRLIEEAVRDGNIVQTILQLYYDLSVQRMIGNDQKIPVRILPSCIGGHGNRAELLSHQEADDALSPAPDAGS